MLIGKFHKLIQSRLLWGVFLVIIVFSFVIWGTPFLFRSKSDREAGSEGKIGGKPVSRQEFRSAYTHIYASLAMGMGRKPDLSGAKAEAALRQAAWRRVASLREAARLGFTASDEEVQQAIAREPYFQHEGRFSLEMYKNFVGQFLNDLGYNMTVTSPYGFVGPKGLPPEIVDRLHTTFRKALNDEASQAIIRRWEMP